MQIPGAHSQRFQSEGLGVGVKTHFRHVHPRGFWGTGPVDLSANTDLGIKQPLCSQHIILHPRLLKPSEVFGAVDAK